MKHQRCYIVPARSSSCFFAQQSVETEDNQSAHDDLLRKRICKKTPMQHTTAPCPPTSRRNPQFPIRKKIWAALCKQIRIPYGFATILTKVVPPTKTPGAAGATVSNRWGMTVGHSGIDFGPVPGLWDPWHHP